MGGPVPPWPEPDPDDMEAGHARIASLEITTRCNLRCLHCYSASGRGHDLPSSEVEHRLAIAREAGADLVILTGGEPLLHPDFDRILEAAQALDLETVMRCNGVLITKDTAHRLKDHGMPLVGISIEGGRAGTNDRVRGEGHFDQAWRAVELLRAENIFVTAEVTLHAGGAAEIPEVARTARDHGASAVIFRRVIPMGRAFEHQELVPTEVELRDARRTIRELDPNGEVLHIGCNLGGRCVALDYFHVDLGGDVHPCYLVRDRLCGITDLPEHSEELVAQRRRLRRACLIPDSSTRAA